MTDFIISLKNLSPNVTERMLDNFQHMNFLIHLNKLKNKSIK